MRWTLAALALALPACDDAAAPGDGTRPADLDEDAGADGTLDGADGTDAAVTWYRDVQPVLQTHCVRCHREDGLGPGDFTNPEVVDLLAPAMLSAIDSGRMPPPVSDPDCADYLGSEHLTLPPEARDTLADWIEAGQPMGDPATAVAVPPVETELVAPDVVVSMPEPYAPTFSDPANPGNEYRCFVIDPGPLAGNFITALAPVLGEPSMVHHIVLYTVPASQLTDDQLDPQGFDCIDGMGGTSIEGMVAAWAPGMLPLVLPDGVGIAVPAERRLVMQMHYFSNGTAPGEVFDQSGYAFDMTDRAAAALVAPLGSYGFEIPAGAAEYSFDGGFTNDYLDLSMIATFPHMHQLGSAYALTLSRADGSEQCLVRGRYDFNNQLTYQWPEPVDFHNGDRLEWTCTWDNTDGDSDVGFGERTDEEMCYFFTLMSL